MRKEVAKLTDQLQRYAFSIMFLIVIIMMAGFNMLPISAQDPVSVSSTSLLSDPDQYDGKTIVFEGEVIGDLFIRENGSWLNVSDGANAIGVHMPMQTSVKGITGGNYKSIGTRISITGTFQRACSQHGGDFDIHASQYSLLEPATPIHHPVRIWIAASSTLLVGPVFLIFRRILGRPRFM